ncbi:MAG: hypothetical protein ACSW8I_10505 [bacterium]
MKTRFFFAAFMLLAVTGMQAQLNSLLTDASVTFPNAADTNIVRNYNDQYAVGYIFDNDTGYFYSAQIDSFSAPSTSTLTVGNKVKVPNNIKVNDMKIYGDYTFFCGNLDYTLGVYGWFRTDELWNSPTVNFHRVFVFSLINLKKMVIANTSVGRIDIIAIGEDNTSLRNSCIVEILDAMNTSVTNCTYAPMPTLTNSQRQTLYDLHVINNQVVFVGMDTRSSYKTIFIRKASSTNVLGDPNLSQVYYYTPANNATILHSIAPCAEVLPNNQVAVAHLCFTTRTNIAVSYIDLGTMNCVSTHYLTNENRSELHEMRYIAAIDNLVLLYNNVSNNSNFLAFHPTLTPTYSSYYLRSNDKYTSLDLLNNQSFISAGKNFWYLQRTTNPTPLYPCFTSTTIPIGQLSYTRTVSNQSITGLSSSKTFFPFNPTVFPVSIRVNCSQ